MRFDPPKPPDRRTGALPRVSRPGELCSLFSERIDVIPRRDWPDLIGEISLRRYGRPTDQDGVGSCAAEACTQSVIVTRGWQGQQYVELNPWSLYYKTSGGADRGSSIDSNLVLARDQGICPMSLHPRALGWRARPSAEALEAAKQYRIDEFFDIQSIEEFGTALLKGFAVQFGWQGHSVLAVELINPDEFIYCNSWSTDWGDEGFGRLALNRVNWGYGSFAVRTATAQGNDA